jgi:hypothetical protein
MPVPTPAPAPAREPDPVSTIRRLLLALVLVGIVGLTLELLLLEHIESATQLIPFVVLGAGFVGSLTLIVRPTRQSVRLFQGIMLLFVASGVVGIYLHLRGNVLFEQETDPSARGLDLIWRSLSGGVPILAPAAMAQVGLVGLLFTYRHPMLRDSAAATTREETS